MQAPPSRVHVKIEFAQASDPGRDPNKQENEDSCGYVESKLGHLCVLCDGMGGHHGGKEASRLAITTIFEVIEQMPETARPRDALKAALEEAARRVYRLGGAPENRVRPGSTVVAMLLHDGGVDVAHVGDSRAYVIRASQIYPLTRDHSMVQGMIDAGMLTEAQAIGHPDANKITRALGMKPEVDVEVRPEPMELWHGDVLLQSSDGLTDLALSADILAAVQEVLRAGTITQACQRLVTMANDRGGHDNITVQMARIVETVPKAKATVVEGPPGYPQGPPSSSRGAYDARARPGVPTTVAATAHGPTIPPNRGLAAPAPAAAWGGVAPTAADGEARGVVPTVLGDAPAPSERGHHAAGYVRPEATLAPYRLEATPPMPPPSPRYGPMATHRPQPSPFASPLPPSMSVPDAQPSRGGLVFLIVALSAVLAIAILLVVWALFLR
jgi:protein phosphatase